MLSIKEKISEDHIKAVKERNVLAKNLLGTVKGEMQSLEKNKIVSSLSDEDAIKVLNKFAKAAKENIEAGDVDAEKELSIIESYLPKQMSEADIHSMVERLFESGSRDVGQFMKAFATLQADKKLVSELVRKRLQNTP